VITTIQQQMEMGATLTVKLRMGMSAMAGLGRMLIRVFEPIFLRYCTSIWLTITTLLLNSQSKSRSKSQSMRMILKLRSDRATELIKKYRLSSPQTHKNTTSLPRPSSSKSTKKTWPNSPKTLTP